jgi:hypothetical protein
MGKTIKDWLKELPDGYRELAMKYENNHWVYECYSMAFAIMAFKDWQHTDEDTQFWVSVYRHYDVKTELPPLP